jgi:hypothetical protein
MKKDKKTGKLIEDNNVSYDKVKTLEEIIAKYGKYDSIKEKKSPLRISKFFIWDELGVSLDAYAETNIVGNIYIQTLLKTKCEKLDLGLVKTYEEERGLPAPKKVREQRENDISRYIRKPKQEYKGKFTYNGKTINFKELRYTDWEKGIGKLGIDNSDYDPPGDSPQYSRRIHLSSDLIITLERHTNLDDYGIEEPNVEEVGEIDFFESIVIWWFKDYEEGKKVNNE